MLNKKKLYEDTVNKQHQKIQKKNSNSIIL